MDDRARKSRKRADGQNGRRITEQNKGQLLKRRRKRRRWFFYKLLFALLLMAASAVYLGISLRYRNTFLPNTIAGGLSVSGKTVDEVKKEMDEGVSAYELTIEELGGETERIYGRDIQLSIIYDETLEEIMEEQNALLWGLWCVKGKEYLLDSMVTFDKEKLKEIVAGLDCMDRRRITEPVDAYLTYVDGSGLQIIPEEPGNEPILERLLETVERAVSNLKDQVSLKEQEIYKKPEILQDDAGLLARKASWKKYTDVTVTYHFGSRSEVLGGSTICQWLSDDEGGNTVINQEKVAEYVQRLAKNYNTAYCAKKFKTSYGPEVTITKGSYGWMIDKQAEAAALTEIILSGESQEREPVYLQRAASHDGTDYGNTYVEMNLTAQHLYFYKDGKLLIESDFVSGNEAKGWSTPTGAYELTYKQRNAVLRGKNYNTPVTYWMPFNGNIGMHDGYWRSSFGGAIYKKNGSHGCINLPPAVAKTIYENIDAGIPVLCYHLEGTESAKTTSAPSPKKTSSPEPVTVANPPETTAAVLPSEATTEATEATEATIEAATEAVTATIGAATETEAVAEEHVKESSLAQMEPVTAESISALPEETIPDITITEPGPQ